MFIPFSTNQKGNIMQKNKLLVAALGALFALPALAADAPPYTITSNVSLVSDYLYRGISQTGANPAIQGGFDVAHASGVYVGVWGSNISWLSDGGVAANASVELDTYFGFRSSFATDFSYDVGYLRYNYPGEYTPSATKADTDEIYGLVGYKWVTLKYSHSLGDTFGIADAGGTSYIELNASYPVSDTGITLGAHYGKQTYKGAPADALEAAGTTATYTDYKLSATKDFSGFILGLAYSKTNTPVGGWNTVLGNDLGKGTAVLSLARSF